MSSYVTLTGLRSGKPVYIKKSAIEMVSRTPRLVPSKLARVLGQETRESHGTVWFSDSAMHVVETYAEVVKALR